MSLVRWFKIDAWHLIALTGNNAAGIPTVITRCGLERPWDGTFLDALPGGSETSCENCLLLEVGGRVAPGGDAVIGEAGEEITEPAKKSRKKVQS